MSRWRVVRQAQTGAVVLRRARWCASWWCRLKGLQFVRTLADDEGVVLVGRRDSAVDASIHMLFMFMDLGVIWVNKAGVVVDVAHARAWRPAYVPARPACYTIEATPAVLARVAVGDHLVFDEIAADGA